MAENDLSGFSSWLLPNPPTTVKGGPGSGDFGHAGRPGSIGGSSAGGRHGGNFQHEGVAGQQGGSRAEMGRHARSKIIHAGGFTWNPHSRQDVSSGYAVSPYQDREKVISAEKFVKGGMAMTRNFARKNADLLSDPKNCIGGWLDKASGKVFLDVSIVTQDKNEAVRLSDKHNQLAFYSLHEGKEYRMSDMTPDELSAARAAKEKRTKGKGSRLTFHTLPGGALSDKDIAEFVKGIADEAGLEPGDDVKAALKK